MQKAILIGVGGFAGAVLRYIISGGVQAFSQSITFPHGTLAVNVIGCFFIGLCSHLVESQIGISAEMRLFLMVGLLGSFTTYSTFSYETINLLQNQRLFQGLLNILAHILLGLAAVLIGRFTIMMIWR